MNFEITNSDKYTVIHTKVEKLDTNYAPELKSELVYLSKQGIKNLVLDLKETRYCDSSGLSAILIGNRLCQNCGGTFVITGLQDAVMKLISISQLQSIINITPTVEEASDFIIMEEVERDINEND